jgi:hypothetical protein
MTSPTTTSTTPAGPPRRAPAATRMIPSSTITGPPISTGIPGSPARSRSRTDGAGISTLSTAFSTMTASIPKGSIIVISLFPLSRQSRGSRSA